MSPLFKLRISLKVGIVSAWLAWQKLGQAKENCELHFHFIYRQQTLPLPPA